MSFDVAPCSCMTFEDDLGQTVCKRCHGDFYACECPVHTRRCPMNPLTEGAHA